MRPRITLLLLLVMVSMLVGTAFAECAAMNMPCCALHHNTNCHEICAAPAGNIGSATVPQFAGDFQAVATVRPVVPVSRASVLPIRYEFAGSTECLLMRIHVLLI